MTSLNQPETIKPSSASEALGSPSKTKDGSVNKQAESRAQPKFGYVDAVESSAVSKDSTASVSDDDEGSSDDSDDSESSEDEFPPPPGWAPRGRHTNPVSAGGDAKSQKPRPSRPVPVEEPVKGTSEEKGDKGRN
ncbi:hypothetical protein BKA70DRAFT_1213983 [Coprinopsis sp. MPI-PUGE-AT-0042]|nr:hypothetical protein BKA70DRAFT_1213983 [Coprinopsis sp. MPI-PUGE-AT-0042]